MRDKSFSNISRRYWQFHTNNNCDYTQTVTATVTNSKLCGLQTKLYAFISWAFFNISILWVAIELFSLLFLHIVSSIIIIIIISVCTASLWYRPNAVSACSFHLIHTLNSVRTIDHRPSTDRTAICYFVIVFPLFLPLNQNFHFGELSNLLGVNEYFVSLLNKKPHTEHWIGILYPEEEKKRRNKSFLNLESWTHLFSFDVWLYRWKNSSRKNMKTKGKQNHFTNYGAKSIRSFSFHNYFLVQLATLVVRTLFFWGIQNFVETKQPDEKKKHFKKIINILSISSVVIASICESFSVIIFW